MRRKEYLDSVSLRDAWKAIQDEADKADQDLDLPKRSFADTTIAQVQYLHIIEPHQTISPYGLANAGCHLCCQISAQKHLEGV